MCWLPGRRGCCKQPGERYDSACALAEDLDRYICGEPIVARPERSVRRVARVARRHRALVATATLALLTVGAAGRWGLRQAAEAFAQGDRADERARIAREQTRIALVRRRGADVAPGHPIRVGVEAFARALAADADPSPAGARATAPARSLSRRRR
jgi:hypothetical protein